MPHYYPYFRGKQFELITIRETASVLAESNFEPIIEPVKEPLGGLNRALRSVIEAYGNATVIVNPYHGDHSEDGVNISALLQNEFADHADVISAGILLKKDMTVDSALALYADHETEGTTFVHAGFAEGKALAEALGQSLPSTRHVFFEAHCGKLYRKHFQTSSERVLLRDGFKRRRNADQPLLEEFSDLHVTYKEEGMNGFGDFLIVGDDYTETGGPAYAVAIHLTFIDHDKDDAMFIYHFVSTTKDTPTDPAGKFAQALEKLMKRLGSGTSKLIETTAIKEFRELHSAGHYPGLGYVKKLSMKHHIETLSAYFT
ncbi:sce7725 family protein [Bradyrhizobium sp. SZCCHNS2096]|uniref:sce7725 family protein n=1 Tax=Bradyrhizobium sp. SZCCHNS2096 TaxID=3057309 RepID=UPI0029162D7C|nr:sce7725 family protein [Bradyrhizobium sp. SZCCHNS2096]